MFSDAFTTVGQSRDPNRRQPYRLGIHRQFHQVEPLARGSFTEILVRLELRVGMVALPLRRQRAGAVLEPEHAECEHHEGCDDAKPGGGKGRSAEERHRNRVLNGRSAGQRGHREGERTQRNGVGNQPFGDVGLPEQGRCDRVDRKRDHCEGRQGRSEDQEADSALGQKNQQTQRNEDDQYSRHGLGSSCGWDAAGSPMLGGLKLSVNRLFRSKVERLPRSSKCRSRILDAHARR